jgi:hypothetical protein
LWWRVVVASVVASGAKLTSIGFAWIFCGGREKLGFEICFFLVHGDGDNVGELKKNLTEQQTIKI